MYAYLIEHGTILEVMQRPTNSQLRELAQCPGWRHDVRGRRSEPSQQVLELEEEWEKAEGAERGGRVVEGRRPDEPCHATRRTAVHSFIHTYTQSVHVLMSSTHSRHKQHQQGGRDSRQGDVSGKAVCLG